MCFKDDYIPTSYQDAVQRLAEWHAEEMGGAAQIYLFEDPESKVVRLLEVTDQTPPSGSVDAYSFRPTANFPFQSQIAQITPEEWREVDAGRIPLPDGWLPNHRRQLYPK